MESLDVGPHYPGDRSGSWVARMRLHQSWYRAAVLGLPHGPGPGPDSPSHFGNFLTVADGATGRNFVDSRAWDAYLARRDGPNVDTDRAERNLLTSQAMCFNLFGPLVADAGLATQLVEALDLPGGVREVTDVRVEFAPGPKSEYLENGSSFDAFVAYVDGGGKRAFLGVETKLTEPFTQSGSVNRRAEDRSLGLTERPDSIWHEQAWPRRRDLRWRQLWQNHLLVEALRRHPDALYGTRGRLVLISHPEDIDCARTAGAYKDTLVDPDGSFIDLPLDVLVPTWRAAAETERDRTWLFEVDRRYLDLTASSDLRAEDG